MTKKDRVDEFAHLPAAVGEYIKLVIKKMGYRKSVREDVKKELIHHFEDALRDCKDKDETEKLALKLIESFGEPKILGKLMKRAKKRFRPLWQKCLVQTSKVIGFVVLYAIVRVVFLTAGTPHIKINYIDWLNRLVAAREVETKNAKSDYDRAAELNLKAPTEIEKKISACVDCIKEFNDLEIEYLVKWLNDNQKSLEALRQGSQKAHYWPIYENQKSGLVQQILILDATKPLSKYKKVAVCMGWQIKYDAYMGKLQKALNNCLVLQSFGMHLQGQGLLVEQIVGVAIEALAYAEIFMLLEKYDIPVEILRDFYNKLERSLINEKPVVNLEAEKVFWYDLIQRGFTDDGKGNGRVLKNGLPLVVKDAPSSIAGFFFWNYPDRREITAAIDKYFKNAACLMNKSPYELHINSNSHLLDEIDRKYFMSKMVGPAHSHIGTLSWRLKVNRSGLITVIAVTLYQKERGHYPENLDELISSGYLKSMPMDPFSDKQIMYKKTGDDFILYSVGLNYIDDGGTPGKDNNGKFRQWADNGDVIFWPAE